MKTLKTLTVAISVNDQGNLKVSSIYSLGSTDDPELSATSQSGVATLSASDLEHAQALYDSLVAGIKARNGISD